MKSKLCVEQRGVSLIELILATAGIGFLVMLIANLPPSFNLISRSKHEGVAREIISKSIEDLRASGYANLANGQTNITDSRINLMPGGYGSIVIEDCPTSICSQGESTKQITITLNWLDGGKKQSTTAKTLLSEGGLK